MVKTNIGLQAICKNDLVVMICGPAGAGKSTLVERLTGLNGLASDGVEPGTPGIKYYQTLEPGEGKPIVIIDTPGFDLDDADGAQRTASGVALESCLTSVLAMGVPNIGIIFVHSITEIRFNNSARMSLRLFNKLRLRSGICRGAVVTTQWDMIEPEIGKKREAELKEIWSWLINEGVACLQLNPSTLGTVWSIIHNVLGTNDTHILDSGSQTSSNQKSFPKHMVNPPLPRQVKMKQLRKDEHILLILGEAGAGRSSLVELLTGKTGLAGHSLSPKTSTIRFFKVNRHGRSIVLVDTPVFNSLRQTDKAVEDLIDQCLRTLSSRKVVIRGLILLHNIQRIRPNHAVLEYLKRLKEIGYYCGPIALVTTMWDRIIPTQAATGDERQKVLEASLSTRGLINLPCKKLAQHDVEVGWRIVDSLMFRATYEPPLQGRKSSSYRRWYERFKFAIVGKPIAKISLVRGASLRKTASTGAIRGAGKRSWGTSQRMSASSVSLARGGK